MLVTLLGMVRLLKPQPPKAPAPMLVTLFNIVSLASLLQKQKASSPMLVTLWPMIALVKLKQL
jgi:hypothetical protein